MSVGAIAVATSIMPRLSRRNAGCVLDSAYQTLCVRSWLDCGFRVISVNHADEIPELAIAYPEVSFVAANRDASAISGRRMPYIADLLGALTDAPEPVVGLINSDLVFEPSPVWSAWLPRAVGGAVVTGQRYDATSLLDGTFRKYYWGFDFFFFDRKNTHDLLETAGTFAMGLPWWDYWLPAASSLQGRQILTLERPAVAHLIHKEPSLDDGWRRLAMTFATFVVQEAARSRGPLPSDVNAILPLCLELSRMPELRWRNRGADAEIAQIAVRYVPEATRNVSTVPPSEVQLSADTPEALIPTNVFLRFAERLSAGEALERAKHAARQGNFAEAKSNFEYALRRAPRDFDLLSALGEFLLRQGDFVGAAATLRKAMERDPDNRTVHEALALALQRSGEHT